MIDENHPRLSLVRQLMRVMGLRSLAPRPNTSRRAPGHRVYPYLLRDLAVGRPNQVYGIRISMDGKGRWIDNVFIERLWRSPASNAWTWRRKTSMSGSPDIGRVAGRSARSVRVHTFAPLAHELHSINNTISIKKEKTKTVQSGSI